MRIDNAKVLEEFRHKPWCELCLQRGLVEPHHIFPRGMGDAFRMDIPQNLLALCRRCHTHAHAQPCRDRLLARVALRMGYSDAFKLKLTLMGIRYARDHYPGDRQAYLDDQWRGLLPAPLPEPPGEGVAADEDEGTVRFL